MLYTMKQWGGRGVHVVSHAENDRLKVSRIMACNGGEYGVSEYEYKIIKVYLIMDTVVYNRYEKEH